MAVAVCVGVVDAGAATLSVFVFDRLRKSTAKLPPTTDAKVPKPAWLPDRLT